MNKHSAIFESKDDGSEIEIAKDDVEEVVPDADFRFSLVSLLNGEKHFVVGTEDEVWEKLRKAADSAGGLDIHVIL